MLFHETGSLWAIVASSFVSLKFSLLGTGRGLRMLVGLALAVSFRMNRSGGSLNRVEEFGGAGGVSPTSQPERVGEGSPATCIRPEAPLPQDVEKLLSLLPPGYRLVKTTPAGERILDAFADGNAGITPLQRAVTRTIPTPAYSFKDFCLDKFLSAKRPFGRIMAEGTFENTERILAQLEREGVPTDPPDWIKFVEWIKRHPKSSAGCENHRRAMVWKSAYYRIPVPDEEWARKRLDNAKDVEVARREGRMKARVRFFRLPFSAGRLVAAEATAHAHSLNAATHRVIAYTSTYVGPRGSELYWVTNGDYDAQLNSLHSWQPKKKSYRDVQPPEDYALGSLLDPSIAWYRTYVRPKLDPDGQYGGPTDRLFLFWDAEIGHGRPWPTEEAYAQFVERGIDAVLGPNTPGPHGWRRLCATLRYRYGWTIEQIASFLDDTDGVVRKSYIDWKWINRVGIIRPEAGVSRPLIPRLRVGQTFGVPESFLGKDYPRAGRRRQGMTQAPTNEVATRGLGPKIPNKPPEIPRRIAVDAARFELAASPMPRE
ncbi:MAG: hypothetical protein QOE90_3503 [Thermoplasmata archaeon]|nr:hypothetical protein [Thermoplasmata archaeon]